MMKRCISILLGLILTLTHAFLNYNGSAWSNTTNSTCTTGVAWLSIETITATRGDVINWSWYANDTYGKPNSSDKFNFTINAASSPPASSSSTGSSSSTSSSGSYGNARKCGEWSNCINNNMIREYVTINRGTAQRKKTEIGNGCLFMVYSHVAHDCLVGNG